jgi:hypothetical protein
MSTRERIRQVRSHVVSVVAQKSGVDPADVERVLASLDIDFATTTLMRIAGDDVIPQLGPDNVVVGLRLDKVLVAK